MSYTPPAGDAANVSWVGVAPYTPPAGDAANVSWVEAPTGVVGEGYVVFDFVPAGEGFHGTIVTGAGAVVLDFVPAGEGRHGVGGQGAVEFGFLPAGEGRHGVAGAGSVVFDFVPAAVAAHPRYELRGEVRLAGVLVNRRVRAYLRSTGAMVGEADTTAGRFAVHAGFAPAEHTVTPIDLSDDATDWQPPTANRVLSVLAEDVP